MRVSGVVACLSALLMTTVTSRAQERPAAVHRVRAEKPAVAALIEAGIARSTTFAALVTAVDSTDGLVYVEEGACGLRVRACLAMSLVVAGPNRVLRVQVRPGRPKRDSIAAIGHELRHAIEVLSDRGIRSSVELHHFFLRETPTARETFETTAAIRAGLDVFKELGAIR